MKAWGRFQHVMQPVAGFTLDAMAACLCGRAGRGQQIKRKMPHIAIWETGQSSIEQGPE